MSNFKNSNAVGRVFSLILLAGTCGLILIGATACQHISGPDTWPNAHLVIPPVATNAYQIYKTQIEAKRNIVENKCVFINGRDIQLPLTSGNFDPQENRTYSFDIWAYDQDEPNKTLEQLREEGTFSLEVIGANATISVPDYGVTGTPPQPLLNQATNGAASDNTLKSLQSHNVLRVQVRSQDLSSSFTIIAWFPGKYRSWSPPNQFNSSSNKSENPYGEKREVKVYNGDLRTRIDIVDEREAEASFGTLFPKYFYVGRIYLRNRHPDKRMVVYTTSLRANVLLYRPPVQNSKTATMQAALTSDQTNQLAGQQLVQAQQTTNGLYLQRVVAAAFQRYSTVATMTNEPERNTNAEDVITNVLARFHFDPGTNMSWLNTNDAVQRVLIIWQGLDATVQSVQQQARQSAADAFNTAQAELAAPPTGAAQDQVFRLNIAPLLLQLGGDGNYSENFSNLGSNGVSSTSLDYHAAATNQFADAGFSLALGSYLAATNAIAKAGLTAAETARLTALASQIYELRENARQRALLARALAENRPELLSAANGVPLAVLNEYQTEIGDITAKALESSSGSPNPFARTRPIDVNTYGRSLALSDDLDVQMQLAKVGYLWQETYRPMTFQAVLNSLMYTDENSYSARAVMLLQTAATVAGGMVGLGTVVHELSSQGYVEGVSFFSTIFVPATSKLLLDDMNKHIRNLGQMAMDTVVVVPPNDVVDQYIFFPKGPIYNFTDEFNVSDPAYIKNIDNNDVGVEATLIDQGVNVQAGTLDSAALTDQALNEGQADLSADLLKQADLKDRLRQLELSTIASQITSLFKNLTNGPSAARLNAGKQACQLVQSFNAQFGEDATGILPGLLASNSVDCVNSPPTFLQNLLPTVDILSGVPSTAFQLPVSDILGVWALNLTNLSSNPNLINSTNVVITKPAVNSGTPVAFTVLATPNSALAQDTTVELTFVAANAMSLTSSVPLHATVHVPQFSFQSLPNLQPLQVTGASLNVLNTNSVGFVNMVLPVYDSELSSSLTNWSFQILSQTNLSVQTNGWIVSLPGTGLQSTMLAGRQNALCLSLSIDPSMATNNVQSLPISILYGGNVIASTNLQLVLPGNNP